MKKVKIECVNKLGVLLSKKKRIKILVGGRASTKSTFVADYVLSRVADFGERWCCSREYQNSIDESVHSLLQDEIERCGFAGFDVTRSRINHASGGYTFYKGLARNIASLKSIVAHGLWIEEGETLSADTLKILTASIRASAREVQEAAEHGVDVVVPEIWVTMNRGSRQDPVSQRLLSRAEDALARDGYYEDDLVMIVQINYDENPWFAGSGLEVERRDDHRTMSRAAYDHKWRGHYSDEVEDSIIKPEWFDACIDAHKVLGFDPRGMKRAAHDPADSGDNKAYAMVHGSVVVDVQDRSVGDIGEACDWACTLALEHGADSFTWDCDGVGLGLNKQISENFHGKGVSLSQYKGSEGPDRPDDIYEPAEKADVSGQLKIKDRVKNKRAQYYMDLADRMRRTFLAVTKGEYHDPDGLISFSSDIDCLDLLRAELCSIPRKYNKAGMFELYTKREMKDKFKVPSPNMADAVKMALRIPESRPKIRKLNFSSEF